MSYPVGRSGIRVMCRKFDMKRWDYALKGKVSLRRKEYGFGCLGCEIVTGVGLFWSTLGWGSRKRGCSCVGLS